MTASRRGFLRSCSAAAFGAFGSGAVAMDPRAIEAETLQHFTALLKLDTSSPPGNETLAAGYLQQVLERESIPVQFFALEPSRGNIVARLRGSGKKKPVLLMAHTDVVGVQRERWSVDPFAAVRKGGYIYGRGATDDRDNLVACLMAMLLLKRQGVPLLRDVIFLAEAGEEGQTRVGIDFMVTKHWSEIECEFALAEGGGGLKRDGKPVYLSVSTAEKAARGIVLKAAGAAGHGSTPTPDNAVLRLANAVARVGAYRTPIRLNDTTRTYFEKLAQVSTPEDAARYKGIVNPARAAAIDAYFLEHEPVHHSMLRTSIAPTMLKAGFRYNVIPSEAEAYLDVRALPDENIEAFMEELRRVIADPKVTVSRSTSAPRPMAAPSSIDSDMYKALETVQRRMYPSAITIPNMMPFATDMAFLRAKGVHAYGVGPLLEERDQTVGGPHSDDERVEETGLHSFVRFQYEAVVEVAGSRHG